MGRKTARASPESTFFTEAEDAANGSANSPRSSYINRGLYPGKCLCYGGGGEGGIQKRNFEYNKSN